MKTKNTRAQDIEEVKEMWNEAARKLGDSPLATTHDRLLRNLEIEGVLKYIPSTKKKLKVLDLGCGNGFSTIEYAKVRAHDFTGVDFSDEMIKFAQKALKKNQKKLKGTLSFLQGDALALDFKDGTLDLVTTGRCLVNLVTVEDQKKGLLEIRRVLKKGGYAILCEGSQQGFEAVNNLRKIAELPLMTYHWHNIYLDETKLVPFMKKHFTVEAIDAFASTYFIASRIFNAISSPDPKKPDYFSKINKVATKLPAIGDYSSLKIYVLRKK